MIECIYTKQDLAPKGKGEKVKKMTDIKKQIANSWIKEEFTFWNPLTLTFHKIITIDRKNNRAFCKSEEYINGKPNNTYYSEINLDKLSEMELYNMI